MIQRKTGQTSFFEDVVYDSVLRGVRHWLLDVQRVVDFERFRPVLEEVFSSQTGRPTNPMVLFKMVFIQFAMDLSDREVEEQVQLNLLYKYFVGLPVDKKAPDHSTLCVFRNALGADRFERMFNDVVSQAREQKLITDNLRIIDSTHIHARVDLFGPHPTTKDQMQPRDKGPTLPGSPDPDATFGRKSATKGFYGFKGHFGSDADSRMMTDVRVTPGHCDDGSEFPHLIKNHPPEAATADKAYDSRNNHNHCRKQRVVDAIIPKKHRYPVDAQLTKRRKEIEPRFAEMKKQHGMNQARYWGLPKVTLQIMATALVVNCKRMVYWLALPPEPVPVNMV